MDLSRRLAAGELAELFGPVALEQDRKTRLFRFRSLAREVLAAGDRGAARRLEAYTRGVERRPCEPRLPPLGVLGAAGSRPRAWLPEDVVLVEYAMWWDLQASGFRREILRRELNARLGGAECAAGWKCALQFLYPRGTSWDAPVDATAAAARNRRCAGARCRRC